MTEHFELYLPAPAAGQRLSVSTLGPPGTSSELAARRYADLVRRPESDIALFPTYAGAAETVLSGDNDVLVVANAFAGVNEFYMDSRLRVATAFAMNTPQYGLAAASPLDRTEYTIVSHPAPVPLISELLPQGHRCANVVHADSTSAAAGLVASGVYPVALTTAPAARRHGLHFFSVCRDIEMVWTAFTPAAA